MPYGPRKNHGERLTLLERCVRVMAKIIIREDRKVRRQGTEIAELRILVGELRRKR